jgi:putative transposase
MARKKKTRRNQAVKRLGTIWEVSDDLWDRILPILRRFWPKKKTGRRVADWRQALNGIIFRLRSGCQWEQLPRRFGPKSTVHDWFQRWNQNGIMAKIMAVLIRDCAELGGVSWEWQSADGAMAKARFGGIISAPTPRIAAKTAPNAAWSWRQTVDRSAS